MVVQWVNHCMERRLASIAGFFFGGFSPAIHIARISACMTNTYTPSWEEYAEQFEYSWPRRDLLPVIVTSMAALFMFIYGIALTRAAPDEPMLQWIFLGTPFFLVFMVAVVSSTNQRRKQVIVKTRAEYDRWHAKPQAFSFDHEKWIHETPAGRHESKWSELLSAMEFANVFLLNDESASVLVPKRVLDPAAVQVLRQSALPSQGEECTFQTGIWDYHAARTGLLWEKQRALMILGNVLGLAALAWVLQSWLRSSQKSIELWGWILAFAALLLALSAQVWYLPLRYITSAATWRLPMRLKLSDLGICFLAPWAGFFVAWKGFLKFKESQRAFLIFTDHAHCYIVPKRSLTLDQQAGLHRMLSDHVKR
jgi:hypothetical protein